MGKIQGEADYDAARRFNDSKAAFVKSDRMAEAARDAEPRSVGEAEEMARVEVAGKRRFRSGKSDEPEDAPPDDVRAGTVPPLPRLPVK